jgi:hypothetical protein
MMTLTPSTPTLAPTFPLTHHLVGRHVQMKFGARWYRGVVTDHDVSTDNELIWHVEFDDGDEECDPNLAEPLPILLPDAHLLFPPSSPLNPLPPPHSCLEKKSPFCVSILRCSKMVIFTIFEHRFTSPFQYFSNVHFY